MAVRVLVVECAAMVGQDLGSHVPLSVPLEELNVGPRRRAKSPRPIPHDQGLVQAVKVRANAKNPLALVVERKVVLNPLFIVPPDVSKHVLPGFVPS